MRPINFPYLFPNLPDALSSSISSAVCCLPFNEPSRSARSTFATCSWSDWKIQFERAAAAFCLSTWPPRSVSRIRFLRGDQQVGCRVEIVQIEAITLAPHMKWKTPSRSTEVGNIVAHRSEFAGHVSVKCVAGANPSRCANSSAA